MFTKIGKKKMYKYESLDLSEDLYYDSDKKKSKIQLILYFFWKSIKFCSIVLGAL